MEIKLFDANDVKERFALLLAKLHDAGFLLDYINQVIVKSPFFDCFENNELTGFMNKSIETITKEVFGKEVIYNYSHNMINPYYWAGLSIMEIMMNINVPIKRILLIMPLKEIVGCFDVYHEMHPKQFVDHYLELENKRSLFRILRNEKDLSISKISALTGIKKSLLQYFDYSSSTFLATSFSNLNKLSRLFDVSLDVFKKNSNYIPYSSSIIFSKDYKSIFIKNIADYYGGKQNITAIDKYIDNKEARKLLNQHQIIVDISNPFGVIYISSNRIIRKYLNKEEFMFLYCNFIEVIKTKTAGLVF